MHLIFIVLHQHNLKVAITWTVPIVVRTPPTLPPITLWSGPHKVMQNPPLRVCVPPSSSTKYDPGRHKISNRPCQLNNKAQGYKTKWEQNNQSIHERFHEKKKESILYSIACTAASNKDITPTLDWKQMFSSYLTN